MGTRPFLFIVSFIFGSWMQAAAQEVMISRQPGERLLVWEDFKGKPEKGSPYFAETYWNLDFKSTGMRPGDEKISPADVVLTLTLNNKKSWVKAGRATTELLNHEQGHFDIGRLCQLEILSVLRLTVLTKANFSGKVQFVFDTGFQKYVALGKKYDEQTNHGVIKEKQAEWTIFLQKEKERLLQLNQ